MPSWKDKKQQRFYLRYFLSVMMVASLLVVVPRQGLTQDASPPPAQSSPAPQFSTEPTAANGVYFADILVRGQPIFQIGSLSNLSASDRAQTINRRIASLLTQPEGGGTVTVEPNPQRGIAILKLNNRVLLTVTQQDAQDFNLPVETLAQKWANALNQAFEQPAFAIDVGQRLWSTLRQLQRDLISNLPSLIGALLSFLATWPIARGLRRLTIVGTRKWQADNNSKILLSRLVYTGVWVVGSVVTLGVLGLDFTTLVGTLGLTSIAVSFSLRDILSNYFSGIILLASRPFRLGDQIVIEEFEGTVSQIQLRATTLITYDGRIVYIPNQEVFTAIIINNTASGKRRTAVSVSVSYDTNINRVKEILKDTILQVVGVEPEPKPLILVQELGATAVQIEVRFWVNSQRLPFVEMTSEAAQAIKEALQQAGINLVITPLSLGVIQLKNEPIESSNHHKAKPEQPN